MNLVDRGHHVQRTVGVMGLGSTEISSGGGQSPYDNVHANSWLFPMATIQSVCPTSLQSSAQWKGSVLLPAIMFHINQQSQPTSAPIPESQLTMLGSHRVGIKSQNLLQVK